jgi:hypothetical protein
MYPISLKGKLRGIFRFQAYRVPSAEQAEAKWAQWWKPHGGFAADVVRRLGDRAAGSKRRHHVPAHFAEACEALGTAGKEHAPSARKKAGRNDQPFLNTLITASTG